MAYVKNREGKQPDPMVAIDHVCAWPNLTLLPDGTIIAIIHNQPSHLKHPADVDCWASVDDGLTWSRQGTPAPRDNERVARGNVAAGQAGNGDLIVISSGWTDPAGEGTRGTVLHPLVSRSADAGQHWAIDDNGFPQSWPASSRTSVSAPGYLVPFGDVLEGQDGTLRVGLYGGGEGATYVYRSEDDGRTWAKVSRLDESAVIHEPALLHLGDGRWLTAARFDGLNLYASDDDAQSWTLRKTAITGSKQHPGHLLRLSDGRVLLSYGNRQDPHGVDVRFSRDEGMTWSESCRVVDFMQDGGYPSSVQLSDGQVLTSYYARQISGHDGYHMGTVMWDPVQTCDISGNGVT